MQLTSASVCVFDVNGLSSSSFTSGFVSPTKFIEPALYQTIRSTKNAHKRIAPVVPAKLEERFPGLKSKDPSQ